MNTDKNLSLRTEILDIALNIEQAVNSLLLIFLNIDKEEKKAISNKSGNLSFKNKIDLLIDLDIFNKEEYKQFLLLMEYRNQFLHNIDCSSFVSAVTLLGSDKEKSLLKYDNLEANHNKEFRYNNAFHRLYSKCNQIVIEKISKKKQLIEDKRKSLLDLNNQSIYWIDTFFDIIVNLIELYKINLSDSPDIVKLKLHIFETIEKELSEIVSTDEYKIMQTQLNNSLTTEKIKQYLK